MKPKRIWRIRFSLNQHRRLQNWALFDLAIDSKLLGCGPFSGGAFFRPDHTSI